MNAQLLKQLSEARAHMKKAAIKMDISAKNKATDQYVCNAQVKVLSAIKNLERALYELEKG